MQHLSAMNDPYAVYGSTGVLGRMRDVLNKEGHLTSAISIASNSISLIGQKGQSEGPIRVDVEGIESFPVPGWAIGGNEFFTSQVKALNNATELDSGFFAEKWSSIFHRTLDVIADLEESLSGVSTQTTFPRFNDLGDKLGMVSKMQQIARSQGKTRDFYYVEWGSFDHHGGLEGPLQYYLDQLNEGLEAYVGELKALDLWTSTVIVETSEFGRHLYPNGNRGTDHGWAGNYFVLGGDLDGGKIIGQYPASFGIRGPAHRMIPTTPWDSVWNAVSEWMGIGGTGGLTEVCPNRNVFDTVLFNAHDMFKDHSPSSS